MLLDTPTYGLLYFPTLFFTTVGIVTVPADEVDVPADVVEVHLRYVVPVADAVVLEAVKLPLVVLLL